MDGAGAGQLHKSHEPTACVTDNYKYEKNLMGGEYTE